MSTEQACSDCYQINLNVCLSEEDIHLLKHKGVSAFTIKNNAHKSSKCSGCSSSNSLPLTPLSITASIPEATILSAQLSNCESSDATFSLFVKLPCDGVDILSIDAAELNRLLAKASEYINGINPPIPGMVDGFNNSIELNQQLEDAIKAGDCKTAKELITVITSTPIEELVALYESLPEVDASTASAIIDLIKRHRFILETSESKFNTFIEQEFTISTDDCEVVTFSVKPLASNVVTSGIVHNDCENKYKYEITRVPNRTFVTAPSDSTLAVCCDGKTTVPINNECCRICAGRADPILESDTLRITVPLTSQLKCLMPDYNILNAYYSATLGNGPTKVRLVSKCPVKFAIPALMSFDKKRCTATIELSYTDLTSLSMTGFEHMFGSLGCLSVNNAFNPNCALDSSSVNLVNAMKESPAKMFQILALSRRLEITGLHKCVDTTLFAFRLCPVPYDSFCVSVCGCKLKTIVDPALGLTVMNAYTLLGEGNVYEFSFLKTSTDESTTIDEITTDELTTIVP